MSGTWDHKALHNLSLILANLYPRQEESRAVARAAGLVEGQIAFHAAANVNWSTIVQNAKNRSKVEDLIDIALEDYPDDDGLVRAKAGAPPPSLEPSETPDWQGKDSARKLEKIIGKRSSLVPISYLKLGLLRSEAVVRVVLKDGSAGSGFLTTDDRLVTNNHVINSKEAAATASVQFNYQSTPNGLAAPMQPFSLDPEGGFWTSQDDDWTVVQFQGSPSADWEPIPLDVTPIERDAYVNIVQHPGGGQKQLSIAANVVTYVGEGRVQYLTDTMPGSSGSPVFDAKWNLVALHHSGGWLTEPNAPQGSTFYRNEGISIDRILSGLG